MKGIPLFTHKVVGVQAMQGPIGLAYALRKAYGIGDIKIKLKITLVEIKEEQDDNNDCSN